MDKISAKTTLCLKAAAPSTSLRYPTVSSTAVI